jgi:hypothetical protein
LVSFETVLILIVSIDGADGLAVSLDQLAAVLVFGVEGQRLGGRVVIFGEIEVDILKSGFIGIGRGHLFQGLLEFLLKNFFLGDYL